MAIIALLLLVLVQAPYRGQAMETERVQKELDEERKAHAKTQQDMKPLYALNIVQYKHPGPYLRAILTPVNLLGVGTQKNDVQFIVVDLKLISSLTEPIQFRRMQGELRIGHNYPLPWFEFMSGHKELPKCGVWAGAERIHLMEQQLREVESQRASRPAVTLDIKIELQDGRQVNIRQINEADPKNGTIES